VGAAEVDRRQERADFFRVVKPGKVLVDHGPVTMTIEAAAVNGPLTLAAAAGAARVLELLVDLVAALPVAKLPIGGVDKAAEASGSPVLSRMIAAVRRLDEADFTPMAAVAGAFSELVAEAVLQAGAQRVVVNNGGDIAFRVPAGENGFQVGIISDIATGNVTHKIVVPATGRAGGIATSGLGGRSLTKGVASAVTVLAESASLADAAATAVANAAVCDHPAVERCLAEELDFFTDIRGHTVTRCVGALDERACREALDRARQRAAELLARGMITGAVVFVQQRAAMIPDGLAKPI